MKRLLLRMLHGKPETAPPASEALREIQEGLRRRAAAVARLSVAVGRVEKQYGVLNADDLTLPDWVDDPKRLLR